MFYLMACGGGLLGVICVLTVIFTERHQARIRVAAIFGVAVFTVIFGASWFTAQGQMVVVRLMASGSNGNWLVIDNSGGKTMRHWVIEGGYVESSSQSDGWQFRDSNGNLCYVSGDAFVIRITEPLDQFQSTYKVKFNIPVEQKALK